MVKPTTNQASEKLVALAKSPFNWISIMFSNLYRKFLWCVCIFTTLLFLFAVAFTCYVTGQPRKKVTTRYYVYELTPTEATNVTRYISQQRNNLLP